MKKLVTILLLSFLFVSCTKDESSERLACGVENPVEDLAWLKSEIEQRERDEEVDYQYSYIKQIFFENKDIYIYGDCDPVANSVAVVYNCSGEGVGYIGDDNYPSKLLAEGIVIWKGEGNGCVFQYIN